MKPNVIVTDGLWRKSMSAVRALGKSHYPVTVLGPSRWTPAFHSRFASRHAVVPSAEDDRGAFASFMATFLKEFPAETLLFPMEDATQDWASQNRGALPIRVLLPPEAALVVAQDKHLTLEQAKTLELPIPCTIAPKDTHELKRALAEWNHGEMPWILKPRVGRGSSGILYESPRDLEAHWQAHGPLMLQERIPAEGTGLGVSLLFDANHRCVAHFSHRRRHQYPPTGGPSTDREAHFDSELLKKSIQLLRSLNWVGVAMVEWKDDPRDGIPKLMEINPRYWGSLELAVRAGVNFPVLAARIMEGQTLEEAPLQSAPYSTETRCRWMIPGEILAFLNDPFSRSLKEWLWGLPRSAEEWDSQDWGGTFASLWATFLLALNPRYWKFARLRR